MSSIILLGETGVGKSSFANKLFNVPKFKVGNELKSETEKVEGYMNRTAKDKKTLMKCIDI